MDHLGSMHEVLMVEIAPHPKGSRILLTRLDCVLGKILMRQTLHLSQRNPQYQEVEARSKIFRYYSERQEKPR